MCTSGMLIVWEQGEISALVNLARTLGGFSVAYFQVPWATKHGALQTFGVEAACVISAHFRCCLFTDNLTTNSIVVGLFFLVVPVLQIKGRYIRVGAIFISCWVHIPMTILWWIRNATRYNGSDDDWVWIPGYGLRQYMTSIS
jgi:hypothetical protein